MLIPIYPSALDIVMEHDQERAEEIREKKFIFHNSKWIDAVTNSDVDHTAYEDEVIKNGFSFFLCLKPVELHGRGRLL
jgi:hypothetical protein